MAEIGLELLRQSSSDFHGDLISDAVFYVEIGGKSV